MSLLFVHIAKTGGTSFRRLLKSNKKISSFDCFHNGSLLRFIDGHCVERIDADLNALDKYDVAVVALRHPLSRLQSSYHYFLSGGLNGRGKGRFPADLQNQKFLRSVAPSFSSCCHNLAQIADQIPHFRPASFWFDSLRRPLAKSVFCCRQESFSSDVNAFFNSIGTPLYHSLERRNQGLAFQSSLGNQAFADVCLVEKFYADDYLQFGYHAGAENSLPLVQFWGQSEIPEVIAKRIKSCQSLNPGWDCRLFNRQTAALFVESVYGIDLAAAFLDIRLPAMQADVFRVAFLLHCGGLWIDAATSLTRPVDSWLDRQHSLQMLRRSHQVHPKIATQIIYAARPGLPLLKAVWNEIAPRLLARSGVNTYRHFGPGLFRDLIALRPNLALGLQVVPELSVQNFLQVGSSSSILPPDQHWTKRQEHESLYTSGG